MPGRASDASVNASEEGGGAGATSAAIAEVSVPEPALAAAAGNACWQLPKQAEGPAVRRAPAVAGSTVGELWLRSRNRFRCSPSETCDELCEMPGGVVRPAERESASDEHAGCVALTYRVVGGVPSRRSSKSGSSSYARSGCAPITKSASGGSAKWLTGVYPSAPERAAEDGGGETTLTLCCERVDGGLVLDVERADCRCICAICSP